MGKFPREERLYVPGSWTKKGPSLPYVQFRVNFGCLGVSLSGRLNCVLCEKDQSRFCRMVQVGGANGKSIEGTGAVGLSFSYHCC